MRSGDAAEDYARLLLAGRERGQNCLAMLMETICATGIRGLEVRYIIIGAVRRGRAEITPKGSFPMIIFPEKLCRMHHNILPGLKRYRPDR